MNRDKILREYSKLQYVYEEFTLICKNLVEQLLSNTGLQIVLPISSRTKEISSLEKNYDARMDITDLSGIRVITYFSDDVDKVGKIIKQEFDVDPNKSVDKRALLDPDRFGYLSLQLICKLSPERLALSEYKAFDNLYCEIQIRSVLQHAWAEIEHDRGYKTPLSIPNQIQRRFARLAGLLELADDEFVGIREELIEYERDLEERILNNPNDVSINRVSLMTLVKVDVNVREIDCILADYLNTELKDIPIDYADARVEELKYLGLNSIAEIQLAIKGRRDVLIKLFKIRVQVPTEAPLYYGVTLFYLTQALIAESNEPGIVAKKLVELKIISPDKALELSEILVTTVRKSG